MPKFRIVLGKKKTKTTAIRVCSKIGGRKSKSGVKSMSNSDLILVHDSPRRLRDKNKIQKEFDYRFTESGLIPA